MRTLGITALPALSLLLAGCSVADGVDCGASRASCGEADADTDTDADGDTDTDTDSDTDADTGLACGSDDLEFTAVISVGGAPCDPCPSDLELELASHILNPCPEDVYLVTTTSCIVSSRTLEHQETGELIEQVGFCEVGEHAWDLPAGETLVLSSSMGLVPAGDYLGRVAHDDLDATVAEVGFTVE